MAGRLEGKVALVTGAASGIGEGTVKRFAEEGASIVVADLQEEAGSKVAASLGNTARFVTCDVTKESDVQAAVDQAVESFGRLDIMVNNAGIVGAVGPIAETPSEAWERTVAVLLDGVFYGMKHAARVMQPNKSGSILSIASTAGVQGGLGPHCYTACKHAVSGLTKSVGSELARDGIRVNAVAPGNTVTAMVNAVISGDPNDAATAEKQVSSTAPLGIAGAPSDIANALLYLASDEARYVTGHTLVVDSGQTAFTMTPTDFHFQSADVLREAGKRGL